MAIDASSGCRRLDVYRGVDHPLTDLGRVQPGPHIGFEVDDDDLDLPTGEGFGEPALAGDRRRGEGIRKRKHQAGARVLPTQGDQLQRVLGNLLRLRTSHATLVGERLNEN